MSYSVVKYSVIGGRHCTVTQLFAEGFFYLKENRGPAEASCKLSPGLQRILHVIAEGYLIK